MKILGVCNGNVSGACLLLDGDLVASANEERFSRIKNDKAPPFQSIKYCLEFAGLEPGDIDYIGCGAWNGMDETYFPEFATEMLDTAMAHPEAAPIMRDRVKHAADRDLEWRRQMLACLEELGFDNEKLRFFDHHLSHAYTAFYPSPFEEALVVTLDARGDNKSATISKASREHGVELLDSTSMFNSLGFFYSFITRHLGFTPDKHEGKVTGLAAYGDARVCRAVLDKMIGYENGKIQAHLGAYFKPYISAELPELEKELAGFSREDISAAAQAMTEEITLAYITPYLEQTGLRHVCLAGGVFGNVKVNQYIQELDQVESIYVAPQMGDGGNAFGGALIRLYERGGSFNYPLKHVYLGPSYTDEQIVEALELHQDKLDWERVEDYSLEQIAKDLDDGVVIGLFSGRMEYGPRALGARSIIVRAIEHGVNDSLNDRLNRSEFMPFAPVTLEEEAHNCYVGWKEDHVAARFMTVCYNCTERAAGESPATAHIDNTARPQVITREYNPLYYDILKAYFERTGIPTFVNTSFNNHEEPIVCSPNDAIQSLLINNVDYVVMDNFVVRRA
jgi:carbamoyltransferase